MKSKTFFLILALLFLYTACKKPPQAELPAGQLKDLNGKVVELSQFKGKPLIVNFWATWCFPCREEIPMLNDLYKKYRSSDLMIIGVSTDAEGATAVRSFQKEVRFLYPVFVTTEGTEDKFGGIWALPTNFFYDRNGKQVAKVLGLQSREFFEQKIHEIMQ